MIRLFHLMELEVFVTTKYLARRPARLCFDNQLICLSDDRSVKAKKKETEETASFFLFHISTKTQVE